jgi:hypothetical protein
MTLANSLYNVIADMSPERDYHFDEAAAATLLDHGSDLEHMNDFGTGITVTDGPNVYENSSVQAKNGNGTGYYRDLTEITHATGSIILIFRMDSGYNTGTAQVACAQGNSGGAQGIWVGLNNGKPYMNVQNGGGVNQASMTATNSIADTDWHILVVNQPGDAGGFKMYLDNVDITTTMSTIGTFGNDEWFDTIAALGAQRFNVLRYSDDSAGPFEGDVAQLVVQTHQVTAGERTAMTAALTTLEPYTSVTQSAASYPNIWWRFNPASGSIPNDPAAEAVTATLDAHNAPDALNATYRFEASPTGESDEFGLRFNGAGGFNEGNQSDAITSAGPHTYVISFRSDGPIPTNDGLYILNSFSGFDLAMHRIALENDGTVSVKMQNSSTQDEWWTAAGVDVLDDNVHTIIWVTAAADPGDPIVYVDGVAETLSGHVDDNVPDDYNLGDYDQDWAVGYRGGVNGNQADDLIVYDVIVYDGVPSAGEALTIHKALTGTLGELTFSTKTIRRTGRRIYSANLT